MMRLSILAAGLSILAMGCGSTSSPTTSTTNPTTVKFTATLLPSNVVPAITNADASGRGTATITLHLTRDAAGTITAVTADFTMDLNSFPAGTAVTAGILHPGVAGVNGVGVVSMPLG